MARNVPLSIAPPALRSRSPGRRPPRPGRRRGQVPGRQLDLDHRLGGALGEQRVAPEVAEAALAPDRRSRPSKPGARPEASMSRPDPYRIWASSRPATPDTWIAGAASRRPRSDRPRARRPAGRTSARRAPGARDDADLELAVASTARSVPNSGHAADEVVGAVDRVDVPADRGARRPRVPYSSPTSPWSG